MEVVACSLSKSAGLTGSAEQEAALSLKEQATAQAIAQTAQVPFSSEKLPSIETTLQMARLANLVYEETPIMAYKDGAKPKSKDTYKGRLVEVGGTDTEMWYYECEEEGTEAILTFSAKNKRCTVIFRGTEVGGTTTFWDSLKDIGSDLTAFKKPLGPDGKEDDYPDCRVHQGFRYQYYGKVTEFRNDGDVRTELRADEGTIEGMVLERALLQKVQKVLDFQDKNGSDTELFVTGHSLGAALSVLFGVRLSKKHPKRHVQVINFGCPKVGNAAFAQLVKNTENLCVQRVAHKCDVVTRAPNFNYNHVGHTIQIDEAAEVKPHAFKWHAGRSYWTNWNPFLGFLLGGIGDHSMTGYIRALNTHANSRPDSTGEKPWLTEYTQQEK